MGENVLLAIGLTLLAGLSTGIGGAIAFFTKRTNTKFLSVALGFSAGVMVYISFMELLADAQDILKVEMGKAWYAGIHSSLFRWHAFYSPY